MQMIITEPEHLRVRQKNLRISVKSDKQWMRNDGQI